MLGGDVREIDAHAAEVSEVAGRIGDPVVANWERLMASAGAMHQGRLLEADRGLAAGLASHGEPVTLKRNGRGRITEVIAAGTRFLPEARVMREVEERYAAPKKNKRRKYGRR